MTLSSLKVLLPPLLMLTEVENLSNAQSVQIVRFTQDQILRNFEMALKFS